MLSRLGHLTWSVTYSLGVGKSVVSLSDVVEVPDEEEIDGEADDFARNANWDSLFLAINFNFLFSPNDFENTSEDVKDTVDEHLDSHPLLDVTGGLRVVLLQPLEPLEGDHQWKGSHEEEHNGHKWHNQNQNTGNDQQNGIDHTEDGQDLHTSFNWDAEAALLGVQRSALFKVIVGWHYKKYLQNK